MKKIVTILALIAILTVGIVLLTGCGAEPTQGEIIGNANGESSNNSDTGFKLYSTDNRAVFNFQDVYYMVFDFEGEKVLKEYYYYQFKDEATAKETYVYMKATLEQEEDNVKDVKQEGRYIILEFTEEEFKDLTKTEVMETYQYLKQVNEAQ